MESNREFQESCEQIRASQVEVLVKRIGAYQQPLTQNHFALQSKWGKTDCFGDYNTLDTTTGETYRDCSDWEIRFQALLFLPIIPITHVFTGCFI